MTEISSNKSSNLNSENIKSNYFVIIKEKSTMSFKTFSKRNKLIKEF